MNTLVIDASIAVKWVVEEDGTPEALALRQKAKLIAPELLVAECANVLWKKVQRGELLKAEALLAARLLQGAEIELLPTRPLFEAATRLSIEIDHAAYREVHHCGDEAVWWRNVGMDPVTTARTLWLETHRLPVATTETPLPIASTGFAKVPKDV